MKEKIKTNKETKDLFDWLETQNASLLSDRNGHWCVAYDVLQTQPIIKGKREDIRGQFFIIHSRWCKSIPSAIRAAQKKIKDQNCPYWMLKNKDTKNV